MYIVELIRFLGNKIYLFYIFFIVIEKFLKVWIVLLILGIRILC